MRQSFCNLCILYPLRNCANIDFGMWAGASWGDPKRPDWETDMDRRNFLTALFCATGAAVAATSVPAEAMSLLTPPVMPLAEDVPAAAIATDADMATAKVDEAYWVYRRRYRRRRRYYYRPRYHRRHRYCRLYRDYYGRLFRRCY